MRRLMLLAGALAVVVAGVAAVAGVSRATSPVSAQSRWVITDLGTLGGRYGRVSAAFSVNNRGQIVGASGVGLIGAGRMHAVLWQNRRIADLDTLGGENSEALAINDHGQIAGWSTTKTGAEHAVLWQKGTMTDLGTLGGCRAEPPRSTGSARSSDGATLRRVKPTPFCGRRD